jgi:hypothetical protein
MLVFCKIVYKSHFDIGVVLCCVKLWIEILLINILNPNIFLSISHYPLNLYFTLKRKINQIKKICVKTCGLIARQKAQMILIGSGFEPKRNREDYFWATIHLDQSKASKKFYQSCMCCNPVNRSMDFMDGSLK